MRQKTMEPTNQRSRWLVRTHRPMHAIFYPYKKKSTQNANITCVGFPSRGTGPAPWQVCKLAVRHPSPCSAREPLFGQTALRLVQFIGCLDQHSQACRGGETHNTVVWLCALIANFVDVPFTSKNTKSQLPSQPPAEAGRAVNSFLTRAAAAIAVDQGKVSNTVHHRPFKAQRCSENISFFFLTVKLLEDD